MSIENAILELAAAMREQAEAQRESNEVQRATAAGYEKAVTAYAVKGGSEEAVDAKAAELAEATGKRAAAAREAQAKDELENAVQKVETEAVAEQNGDPDGADAAALDYNKDVKPKLLAHIKRVGKEKVQALIKSFGVEKGDQVPAEKLAELLTKADALDK